LNQLWRNLMKCAVFGLGFEEGAVEEGAVGLGFEEGAVEEELAGGVTV